MTTNSYIWPNSIRTHLETIWNLDINQWWLSDISTAPAMVLSLRQFINERVAPLSDEQSEALRDMRGMFKALSFSEPGTPESVTTPGSTSGALSGALASRGP
jgi:hypothetical protein